MTSRKGALPCKSVGPMEQYKKDAGKSVTERRRVFYSSNKNQAVDDKAPSAGAKSLCIPHDQARFGEMPEGQKCVGCGQPAKRWTMFGRSKSIRLGQPNENKSGC